MRVVVTGGAGFIGANLVRTLLAAGHDVAVLDDLSSGSAANLERLDVAFTEGSVTDATALERVCAGADAVAHLAARPSVARSVEAPRATHDVNATGTLEVLEAARRAGNLHVVVASSAAVYGANPTLPKTEELAPEPLSPYAASKLADEAYARAYAHCYGLPVTVFRFFNVFGPLQPPGHAYGAAIPAFVDAALAGRPLPLFGDGQQTRDFIFVGSVVAVLVDALERGVTSAAPVNLAIGSRRSLLEVIAELERQLGQEVRIERHPPRAGDVRHSQADQARLRGLFPDVEPVPFAEGLAATIAWFGARGRT